MEKLCLPKVWLVTRVVFRSAKMSRSRHGCGDCLFQSLRKIIQGLSSCSSWVKIFIDEDVFVRWVTCAGDVTTD